MVKESGRVELEEEKKEMRNVQPRARYTALLY